MFEYNFLSLQNIFVQNLYFEEKFWFIGSVTPPIPPAAPACCRTCHYHYENCKFGMLEKAVEIENEKEAQAKAQGKTLAKEFTKVSNSLESIIRERHEIEER